MKKTLALAALIALSLNAHAAGSGTGAVNQMIPLNNGIIAFSVTGTQGAGKPACATGQGAAARFAINTSTQEGKVHMAAATVAYSLGKTVTWFGKGTCTAWSDTEDLSYFVTAD